MSDAAIGIIGTLVGTISGGVIGYYSAKRVALRQEFFRAASEFRAAFTEEIRLLQIQHPNPDHCVQGEFKETFKILQGAFVKHRNAAILFEPYLKSSALEAFRKTWNEFCCFDKKFKLPTFKDYVSSDHNEELRKRKLALDRIEALSDRSDILKIDMIPGTDQVGEVTS